MIADPSAPSVWLFDLDDTLYPESAGLFIEVRARIRRYIQERFDLDEDAAAALQKRLRDEHGTSLNGLMALYVIDPEEFLEYVHDLDMGMLLPNPGLRRAIEALPGRKLIFTNADATYGARVLARLGLDNGLFEAIYDIRAANYVPKPTLATYERIAHLHGFDPAHALMIDDRLDKLRTAAMLGLKTAWSRPLRLAQESLPDFVHHDAIELEAFLRTRPWIKQSGDMRHAQPA